MTKIEQMRAKVSQLAGSMAAIAAAAEAENRGLTPEEQAQFDGHDAELKTTEGDIARLERLEEIQNRQAAPQPRVVAPAGTQPDGAWTTTPVAQAGNPTITGGTPVAHSYANHGFKKGAGEYLMAVRNASVIGRVDPRLMVNAITTFGGEAVGGDGGYALPPQFANEILAAVTGYDSFISALRPIITQSNLIVVPVDETTPWSSTGMTAAKTAEGAAITASKPAIKQVNVQLYAAKALVHVSDENLQDVSFLSSYVLNKMAEKIRYICEDWCVNGSGTGGEPLGMTKGPGLVTVAKESTQTRASTPILPPNLAKMCASHTPGGMSRCFWLVNPTVLPSIWTMATASTGYPLYLPDFSKAPGGMLLGRPVYTSEACAIAGSANDIICVDPQGVIFATKAEGIATATTIAFAFDQGLQSFRATMRCGCAPVLQAKVTRAKSATEYIGHVMNLGV